jgi:hypothetical protein
MQTGGGSNASSMDGSKATKAVSFPQSRAWISSGEQSAIITGSCGVEGAGQSLVWRLLDPSGADYAQGQAACDASSQFQFDVQTSGALECGKDYVVMLKTSTGDEASAAINKLCPP